VTEAEKWSVGVTAHHLASVLEPVSSMIRAVVAGQATSGTVLQDMPPLSAEQLIAGALLGHIGQHYGSIRKTVGH
jgi:hypothetical protein